MISGHSIGGKVLALQVPGKAQTFPLECSGSAILAIWTGWRAGPGLNCEEAVICFWDSCFPGQHIWMEEHLGAPPMPFQTATFYTISGAHQQQLSDCSLCEIRLPYLKLHGDHLCTVSLKITFYRNDNLGLSIMQITLTCIAQVSLISSNLKSQGGLAL